MKQLRELPLPEIADDQEADTVEMELSPEEQRALSLAAGTQDPESPPAEVSAITEMRVPAADEARSSDSSTDNRWSRRLVAGFIGIAALLIVVGSVSRCTENDNPAAAVVAVHPVHQDVPAVPAAGLAPALPASPPVRIKNPFDKSEVFEFPAGTSEADARASVAEVLLQRARDRR